MADNDRQETIEEIVAERERKLETVGNAAALREALLRCDAIAQFPETRELQSIKDMRNIIRAALSAPPRNCDRFNTAWGALKEWHGGIESAEDIARMLDWLLATAKEGRAE